MTAFRDYIADAITAYIADPPTDSNSADLVLTQGEDDIIYADPEAAKVFLITVKEAMLTVAP
jgi:hypothetical protein